MDVALGRRVGVVWLVGGVGDAEGEVVGLEAGFWSGDVRGYLDGREEKCKIPWRRGSVDAVRMGTRGVVSVRWRREEQNIV